MRDDDLSNLLRSPALSLEPPPDLLASVRAGARQVRRRRAVGAALSVMVLAGGGVVVQGLLQPPPDRVDVAAEDLRRQFPDATSEVAPLVDLAGGTVFTYFRGGQWCTVSKRIGPPNTTCAGSVRSPVRAFAFIRGPGTESLAVDRDFVVAGVLGDSISSVEVELADGRVLRASTVQAAGFPRPVWFQELAPDDRVTGYTARDASGDVVEVLVVAESEPVVVTATPG